MSQTEPETMDAGPGAAKHVPLVSMCIPVYNTEEYVAEAIESVLQQRHPRIEILVQDNASTDGTWPLLRSLAEKHSELSIERNDTNVGMAPNWNIVMRRAKGDFVTLLSADDMLEPGFIKTCLDVFDKHPVGCVTTNHFIIMPNGRKALRKLKIAGGLYRHHVKLIVLKNPFHINFSLYRRKSLEKMLENGRLFIDNLACDGDLAIRLATSGMALYFISEPLGTYRLHQKNLSETARGRHRHDTWRVLRRHRDVLNKACWFAYRFTLAKWLFRILRQTVRLRPPAYRGFDRHLFGLYLRALFQR